MAARIYQPSKTAMQSGLANTKAWVLDFEPEVPRQVEPLMGWTSSGDMRQQLRLCFGSKEEAIAYCERHGIAYQVFETTPRSGARSPTPIIFPSSAATPGPIESPGIESKVLTAAQARLFVRASLDARVQIAALGRRALAQQRNKTLFRHGLSEQEALAVVAPHAHQSQRIGSLFDARGNDVTSEIMRKIDHRLA